MPDIAEGDIFEVRVYVRNAGQLGMNVRHMRVYSPASEGAVSFQQLANALALVIQPLYTPLLNITCEFRGVTLQRVSTNPPSATYAAPNLVVGTLESSLLPSGTAGLIALKTDEGGRRHRGRMYIPFPCHTHNSDLGHPTEGYRGSLADIGAFFTGAQFITTVVGDVVMENVVFHRDTLTGTGITSFTVRNKWALQERRADYGPLNLVDPV
jgi:hypothetical protein